MGISKFIGTSGLMLALAACGGSKPEQPAVEEAPASMAAGLYELSAEVTDLASTDNTTPATKLKKGDKQTIRACVADGKPAPELLAEAASDKCELKTSYIRNGRMTAEASCTRPGQNGGLLTSTNGSFTASGFEGQIISGTYFAGDGDYRMTRKISAKHVGECPAEGAVDAAAEATETTGG